MNLSNTNRFIEEVKMNANMAMFLTVKNPNSETFQLSDGTTYLGKNPEILYNDEGDVIGQRKGIPFVRTTLRRHEV